MKNLKDLKVALVHDWLNGMRGGEKVLSHLLDLFPNAEIFTLHSDLKKVEAPIKNAPIHHSFIQYLPFKKKFYRNYLPLFPLASKTLMIKGFDLILSTSHCAAKNISHSKEIPHLCYCFSPMRYIWGLQEDYFGNNLIKRALLKPIFTYLRYWDKTSSKGVDQFIAISKTIKERISSAYDRDSIVIFPPNEIPFQPEPKKEDYFLVLSALVPYKKIDLAINAFNELGLPLKIAGTGPLEDEYRSISKDNIEFLGWVSEEKKKSLLKKAKALIFPGFEDFGIVPLEAVSFLTPVIGFGKGGVSETIDNQKTGLFFDEQTVPSLVDAVKRFQTLSFDPVHFSSTTERFSSQNFMATMEKEIRSFLKERNII